MMMIPTMTCNANTNDFDDEMTVKSYQDYLPCCPQRTHHNQMSFPHQRSGEQVTMVFEMTTIQSFDNKTVVAITPLPLLPYKTNKTNNQQSLTPQ